MATAAVPNTTNQNARGKITENSNLFTLDYLFHNYKFIKRKLTAVEMRKIGQRRMAEKLKADGYNTKGVLDSIIEEDVTIENTPQMTPRGITMLLTSEKTTLLGLTEGQTIEPTVKTASTKEVNSMQARPDLEGGDSENNSSCELCGDIAIFNGFACRICPRRYHAECLDVRALMNANEIYLMTMIGPAGVWSCHECCNLESFLRENEIAVVRRKFNKIDKDGDGSLTIEEYLKHKSIIFGKVEGHASMEDDMKQLIKQFHMADLDRDGELTWVEFVTNEARRYLPGRDPKDLVIKLTPKEISRARDQFEIDTGRNTTFVSAWTEQTEDTWKAYLKENAVNIILARANQWPEKDD